MIDSHCHLNFPIIKDNIKKIISNDIENKITSILSINTEPDNFIDHLKLIENYKSVYIAYGLHPLNVNNQTKFEINNILNNIKNDKVIGIGETGLDLYYSSEFKSHQIKVFETHIEASIESNLPIIIHQRNSEDEIMKILSSYKNYNLSLIFHCFTGTSKLFNFIMDNNFYISLSGIITFKNAENLRKIVKNIKIDNLLIETDSPFLSPVPMRGKSNEPSYVKYTAEYLSNFYNISFDDFIKITDNNFYKLFSKAKRYSNFE